MHKLSSRHLELTVASFCSLFRRPFLLLNKGSTLRLPAPGLRGDVEYQPFVHKIATNLPMRIAE